MVSLPDGLALTPLELHEEIKNKNVGNTAKKFLSLIKKYSDIK
jgi:hypothetical protein